EYRLFLLDEEIPVPLRRLHVRREAKPVETMRRQRQHVGQLADGRKRGAAEHFDRHAALEALQIELGGLRRAREVGHAKDGFIRRLAQIRQDLAVAGPQERESAATEGMA